MNTYQNFQHYSDGKPFEEKPVRRLFFMNSNVEKILNDTKTMTARCWKVKPPEVGQLLSAQTGRANGTRCVC